MPNSHHAAASFSVAAVQVSYIYPVLHSLCHWIPHLRDLGILHGQLLSESFPAHLWVWELAHLLSISDKGAVFILLKYGCYHK